MTVASISSLAMPKIVDHALYRKQLLSQCFDLFAERGYAAITMRQIAQGLGVSTGTLYHYFPSKEALFEQLVEETTEQDILRAEAELEAADSLSDRLTAVFAYLEKNQDYFFKQTVIFLDFWQQQQRDHQQYSDALNRSRDRIYQAIANLLGIADPDVVDLLYCLIDGLLLSQMYGGRPVNFAKQAELLATMLKTYVEPVPSELHPIS